MTRRAAVAPRRRDRGVFVPAVMGAGVVFSAIAVLRDLFQRSSMAATERTADVRGRLVAADVLGRLVPPTAPPRRSPRVMMLSGLLLAGVATYVLVRGPMSFLRGTGWLAGQGLWLAVNVLAGVALLMVGVAAVAAADEHPPSWVWPVLVRTPLVRTRAHVRSEDAYRWAGTLAAGLLAVLTLTVSRPGFLEPIDGWLADRTQTDWLRNGRWLGDVIGATEVSLVLFVLVGVATWRCVRFAKVYLLSVGISLGVGMALRLVVDRPRPGFGPMADEGMSFPSGHLVQATVLVVLVPLALRELTRRQWVGRVATVVMVMGLGFVSVHRVAFGAHHASDIVAGILLGLAVGWWAKASLLDPGLHPRCHGCSFQPTVPPRPEDPVAPDHVEVDHGP